ncbi:hypothetical protein ABBQ32_001997 [Trebouxia sp. C0010 RCD-2024]
MAWYSRTGSTSNNVFLPALVTFAGFLALLVVFSLVRYSKGHSQSRQSAPGKQNGSGVRRSTRERKEVDRWSPEKTMSDSPSSKTRSKTPASSAVQKVIVSTEGALASPVSAVKKSRLAKSLGVTATSPSPPKRSRQTPAKARGS